MAEELNLKRSYGNFEAIGTITVTPEKTFQKNLKGKGNPDFQYSRINLKMDDDEGNSFYLNAMDGFNIKNGRTIYAKIKDAENGEQLKIQFADRKNEEILKQIDNSSFVSVALRKTTNEQGHKVWEYTNFLALYDAIEFISTRLETGMKLRITGRTGYSEYNGDIQKDFNINNIYLLSEEDDFKSGFTFRQDVILKEGAVDLSKWEELHVATINSEVLTKSKQQYHLYKLPLVVRAAEGKEEMIKKMIDKFLVVEEGKVRRIKLEGKYKLGYQSGQIKEEDLPEEALELIEDGLYDKEEVLKMYVNRERVDELLVIRPVVFLKRGESRPTIDYSDEDYTLEELDSIDVKMPWEETEEKTTEIAQDDDDLSFLDELD